MKRITFISKVLSVLSVFLLSCATTRVQKMETKMGLNIIPKPSMVQQIRGSFFITAETKIFFDQENDEIKAIGDDLAEKINQVTGFELKAEIQSQGDGSPSSILLTTRNAKKDLSQEGYELLVDKNSVVLRANTPAGLFYGVQTLRQLLPPEIESKEKVTPTTAWMIPCGRIEDKPRFAWRGMLLDCGRHFMTKDFVKRYIDLLAYYKMNRFHWHLTEDQGWRIEIKKYPKLTEIGAWRKYEDGTVYGGFYTQDEIKEVVEYAKSRYVTVIPEIELPGHCVAALAAYPQFSCTGGPFEVQTQWGVHKDVYCAGNDETYKFLEDILSEVIELFPAPYIHIGGDEVPKDRWKECPRCQARIKAEGLKDESELQSYFIKRIEKFLLSKNRRLIGWDEILEGGLAPEATVQSWRGMDGAIAATKSGHDAIVSPFSHAYFNLDIESLNLRQVYFFEPIPPDLTAEQAKHIIGGECTMWTENAPQAAIDSMMFPRLLAMSEVLWSELKKKDYLEFHRRVRHHYQRLELLIVNYGPESKAITILPVFDASKQEFKVALEAGEPDLQIYFTLDGSDPSANALLYQKPIRLKETSLIKAKAFREGAPYGDLITKTFIFHQASGKPVQLSFPYSSKYTGGGDQALTDGITGTTNFRDGFWQGFEQDDLDAVIDLGKLIPIRKIVTTFLQNAGSWIFMPDWVQYALSNDGENFQTVAAVKNEVPTDYPDVIIKEFNAKLTNAKARYIKIYAKNIGVCPPNHPGAGDKAWIFVDEIVVW